MVGRSGTAPPPERRSELPTTEGLGKIPEEEDKLLQIRSERRETAGIIGSPEFLWIRTVFREGYRRILEEYYEITGYYLFFILRYFFSICEEYT